MMRLVLACSAALACLALATASAAHHSFAMFDRDKTQTISGTVKALEPISPHGWLRVLVADPSGGQTEWSIEMGGPGQLGAIGLSPTSIHPGDKVAVQIHPLRDGSYGGQFISVTLPNGQVLGQRRVAG